MNKTKEQEIDISETNAKQMLIFVKSVILEI